YSETLFDTYLKPKEKEVDYLYFNDEIKDLFGCSEKDIIIKKLKELFSDKEIVNFGIHSLFKTNKENKNSIRKQEFDIIIASSGMCDNGSIIEYLNKYVSDEKNSILFTGFTAPNTNGAILKNIKNFLEEEQTSKSITLNDKTLNLSDVKIEIFEINGYSGHADQESLLNYLIQEDEKYKHTYPYIFLNHGNNNSREELKKKILERVEELNIKYEGIYKTEIIIPMKNNGWYNLDSEELKEEAFIDFRINESNNILIDSINSLVNAIKELTDAIKSLKKD
ncbi:hypothetical protein JXR93_11865, partial [bacterium]|nr:hypothetical protein [bacterium]